MKLCLENLREQLVINGLKREKKKTAYMYTCAPCLTPCEQLIEIRDIRYLYLQVRSSAVAVIHFMEDGEVPGGLTQAVQ